MPTSITKHKQAVERLEARVSSEKKLFLKHAADLVGRTLTDFVVHAAYEAATRVIKEHEHIGLSIDDGAVFIHALKNAQAPSKALLSAVKRYKKEVAAGEKARLALTHGCA